ncbi:MAG: HAMP domain-containing histidine kinase [Candidatus Krumholzibacteria bacterium]|nr:HAMP domain-containing histidine kinase [Candidatus Krumholzibacteria bacterium]
MSGQAMEVTNKSSEANGATDVSSMLEQELERKNMAFEALFRLMERIGTTLDLETIVRLFLMTLAGQLSLDQIAFYLVSSKDNIFRAYYSLGIGTGELPPTMDRSSYIVRTLGKKLDLVEISESQDLEAYTDPSDDGTLFSMNGFSYAFPLIGKMGVLGIILMSRKIDGSGFTRFNGEILHVLTRATAMAVGNAMLYNEVLLSNMEMEDFARVKKEFLSHTSHELRTPLTILKSSLWSIEEKSGNDGVLMELACKAVTRLGGVVDQLLSLNDIGTNASSLSLVRTNILQLLESSFVERISEISEMGVTFKLDKMNTPEDLYIDATKMRIVFKSIIDNAVSSVESGGNIYLSVSTRALPPDELEGVEIICSECRKECPVEFAVPDTHGSGFSEETSTGNERKSGNPVEKWVVIRVSDNGIGIPEEEIRTLSEPFTRASNSKMADVKGLGLGLSVSSKIIYSHGGRFFCKSEKGKGAEFAIWLPVSSEREKDQIT